MDEEIREEYIDNEKMDDSSVEDLEEEENY